MSAFSVLARRPKGQFSGVRTSRFDALLLQNYDRTPPETTPQSSVLKQPTFIISPFLGGSASVIRHLQAGLGWVASPSLTGVSPGCSQHAAAPRRRGGTPLGREVHRPVRSSHEQVLLAPASGAAVCLHLRPVHGQGEQGSLSGVSRTLREALGSHRDLGLATSLEPAAEQGLWGPQTMASGHHMGCVGPAVCHRAPRSPHQSCQRCPGC